MSVAVTLDHINVLIDPSFESHEAFFENHLTALKLSEEPFDQIIFASSTDLTFLTGEHTQALMKKIMDAYPHAKTDLITQGCLGLYASVMHFTANHHSESALVIMLETPFEPIQVGLNSSKLGRLPGQNGMLAHPSVGFCRLQKKDITELEQEDLIIDVAEIVAKGHGLNANFSFLKRILDRIQNLQTQSNTPMVSFEIRTELSDLFMKFLQPELLKIGLGDRWLPSFEEDEKHIFSLKPLVEIQRYQAHLEHSPLINFGLGAGGRLGMLRVVRLRQLNELYDDLKTADLHPCPSSCAIEYELNHLYQTTAEILETIYEDHLYSDRGKEIMLTLKKEHLGIDNMYFLLPITRESLNSLTVPKYKSREIARHNLKTAMVVD